MGTVTGIYKSKIEVMFDEPFIGATSLCGRCYFFRGAVVNILEIFNLSEWKPFVNLKKDIKEKLETQGPDAVQEWDGKLDGFLLMDEILKIKSEAGQDDFAGYQLDYRKEKKFTRKPYGDKKGGRKGNFKGGNDKKADDDDGTLLDAFGGPDTGDNNEEGMDEEDFSGPKKRDKKGNERKKSKNQMDQEQL